MRVAYLLHSPYSHDIGSCDQAHPGLGSLLIRLLTVLVRFQTNVIQTLDFQGGPDMQYERLLKFRLAGCTILATASLPMTSALAVEPVLPTSENGFYMIQGNPDELSEYMPVDALCISETLDNFAALKNAGHGTADFMLLNRDGKLSRDNFRIMGPDAGASQIRYTLNDPASGDIVVELNYINPGALGDPSTLPMAALSSISIPIFGSTQGRCLLDAGIVYAGVDRNRKMLVIMEEDGSLTLHESSEKNESIAKIVAGGFWSTGKADDIIFSFIEGSKLTTIKAAPHQHIEYPAWRVADRDGRQFSSSPQGFFRCRHGKTRAQSESITLWPDRSFRAAGDMPSSCWRNQRECTARQAGDRELE